MTHPLTFPRGGITLTPRGEESRRAPIANAAMPSVAVVPVPPSGRGAAVSLVAPGDRVAEGQLIGRPDHERSVPIHAPIPGTVVETREVGLHDGTRCPAVVIELGGAFARSGRPPAVRDWTRMSRGEVLAAVRDAGVALDGSQEPLAARLEEWRSRSAQVLVAGAVESQPWLAADSRLLADRPAEIAEGLRIAQAVLGTGRVVLAVAEHARPSADVVAAAFASAGASLEVSVFDERYPQEEESQLAAALIGRAPPHGGTSLDLGVAVLGISSLLAVRDAVVLGKPCFERVVTLAGPALRTPRNLKVRFGTRTGELLEETDGFAARPAAVVFGSPMMGHALPGDGGWPYIPVTRDVRAVLFLDHADLARGRSRPCLRCGRCLEVCPWGLSPVRLYELAGSGALGRAAEEGLAACTGCGCCTYECPSRIPLAAGLRGARALLAGGAA